MPRPIWHHAASFAARAHRHQTRKDGHTPFFVHPFRVSMIVRDKFGCDDDVAIAVAMLHDVIEDTPADYDDIERAFGRDVADAVAALTKNMTLPEPQREPEYDARLARADWRARLVKLADTYDNLLDRYDRSPKSYRKMLARCRRAIELATPDAGKHTEISTGIAALEVKMAEVEASLLDNKSARSVRRSGGGGGAGRVDGDKQTASPSTSSAVPTSSSARRERHSSRTSADA